MEFDIFSISHFIIHLTDNRNSELLVGCEMEWGVIPASSLLCSIACPIGFLKEEVDVFLALIFIEFERASKIVFFCFSKEKYIFYFYAQQSH